MLFREKYGPVVRLKMAGQTGVYVTSPDLIQAIYRDSKSFTFPSLRQELSGLMFGADPTIACQYGEAQVFTTHARSVSLLSQVYIELMGT